MGISEEIILEDLVAQMTKMEIQPYCSHLSWHTCRYISLFTSTSSRVSVNIGKERKTSNLANAFNETRIPQIWTAKSVISNCHAHTCKITCFLKVAVQINHCSFAIIATFTEANAWVESLKELWLSLGMSECRECLQRLAVVQCSIRIARQERFCKRVIYVSSKNL